jgi:hypothetical protein
MSVRVAKTRRLRTRVSAGRSHLLDGSESYQSPQSPLNQSVTDLSGPLRQQVLQKLAILSVRRLPWTDEFSHAFRRGLAMAMAEASAMARNRIEHPRKKRALVVIPRVYEGPNTPAEDLDVYEFRKNLTELCGAMGDSLGTVALQHRKEIKGGLRGWVNSEIDKMTESIEVATIKRYYHICHDAALDWSPEETADVSGIEYLENQESPTRNLEPDSRRAEVEAFLAQVWQATGRKAIKKDIWRVAGYKDRTEFERFQKGKHPDNKSATQRFQLILGMTPAKFVERLEKLPPRK